MQLRTRAALVLVPFLISLVYLATRIVFFIHLFFEHSGIGLTQTAVRETFLQYTATGGRDPRPEYIPRHIHQVWHDLSTSNASSDVLPPEWQQARETCRLLMPDWSYTLWTAQASRDFIEEEYPWFLSTYDGYALPIQRVDTVRYFIMRHYGGIYMDLENGCLQNLVPLLHYPTWVTDGGHGALSNNILASHAQHPFWILLTESLIPYNWHYLFPYVTTSYASGQWFLTAMWEIYHAAIQKPRMRGSKNHKEFQGHDDAKENDEDKAQKEEQKEEQEEELRLYRIMMDSRPNADPWIFFTHVPGETWKSWDHDFFIWIGNHLILLSLAIFTPMAIMVWFIRRWVQKRMIKKKGYARVLQDGYDLDVLAR